MAILIPHQWRTLIKCIDCVEYKYQVLMNLAVVLEEIWVTDAGAAGSKNICFPFR